MTRTGMCALARGMRGLAAAGALGLSMVAAPAAAEEFPTPKVGYTADTVTAVGEMQIVSTVWHQDGKERREMTMSGEEQVVIVRPDTGRLYVFVPAQGMAMDMAYDPKVMGLGATELMAGLNPVADGREEVGGISTTRYRIDGTGPTGSRTNGLVWVSDDGIIVRMEGESEVDGTMTPTRMETTNLETGDQDAALFELPEGLQVMRLD